MRYSQDMVTSLLGRGAGCDVLFIMFVYIFTLYVGEPVKVKEKAIYDVLFCVFIYLLYM